MLKSPLTSQKHLFEHLYEKECSCNERIILHGCYYKTSKLEEKKKQRKNNYDLSKVSNLSITYIDKKTTESFHRSTRSIDVEWLTDCADF